jgi:hypothetical protein
VIVTLRAAVLSLVFGLPASAYAAAPVSGRGRFVPASQWLRCDPVDPGGGWFGWAT